MKTDDLIAVLAKNVERVDRQALTRTLFLAIAAGVVATFVVTLIVFGVRADLSAGGALFLAGKVLFAVAVVVLAAASLTWHARPGGERQTPIGLAVLPLIAVVGLAAVSLAAAPHSHWERMLVGDNWLECLLSIPIIAVLPFAALMWAVRRMAPTNLTRTGALVGLCAGGVSALGYALHCTDDSLPFVALWYGGTIILCAAAGAALGPRLLRW